MDDYLAAEFRRQTAAQRAPAYQHLRRALQHAIEQGALARFMADGKSSGRTRSALDTIIAAVAEANGCVVVTDNEKDFAGVEIINPLREG